MVTAEITVKFCNPRQEGKKNASIKTDDGQIYLVPPGMFSQFEPNGRYNIQYKTSNFKGVEYRYVETVTKAASQPVAPNVHNAMTKAKYGTVDMATAERIFVCGAMNAMLSNTNTLPFALTGDNLIERVNILRDVWRQTLGNPQQDAEMDDSIPY